MVGLFANSGWRGVLNLGSSRWWGMRGTEKEITLPGKTDFYILVPPEAVVSFRWCRIVWKRVFGSEHVLNPHSVMVNLPVYFLRRYLLLDNKAVNFLCKKIHHHCTLSVHSLSCLQHSSSPGLVHVPISQLEMVQRSMFSALDLLIGKAKLKTQRWVWVGVCWAPDLPIPVKNPQPWITRTLLPVHVWKYCQMQSCRSHLSL